MPFARSGTVWGSNTLLQHRLCFKDFQYKSPAPAFGFCIPGCIFRLLFARSGTVWDSNTQMCPLPQCFPPTMDTSKICVTFSFAILCAILFYHGYKYFFIFLLLPPDGRFQGYNCGVLGLTSSWTRMTLMPYRLSMGPQG